MGVGLFRRTWQRDRLALGVMAVGATLATLAWRGTTRPMADTITYRQAAQVLRDGWPTLTARTPGYPAVLLVTGSSHGSTHLLFFVQMAMHVMAIVLVVDLARRHGVGRNGRAVLAALLFAPAVLLRVVYEGSECTAALLVTVVFWLLLTPPEDGRRVRWELGIGLAAAAAGLVRPNYAILFVPVALLAAWDRRQREDLRAWGPALRSVALISLPAIVLVGGYSVLNGVRFDSFGLTPLTPYHLNSKTSPYVENLPTSYEPARSVLIRERNAALLRGESMAPDNYIYGARPELERVTGLRGRALDRYVMRIDLELIANNPFAYLDTVKTASVNYASMDSQGAILGLGRPVAWTQQAVHELLLIVFVLALALVPGLALAGQVDRSRLWPVAVGVVLAGFSAAVSVMTETGTARIRAPTEPILALVFVLSLSIVRSAASARRRSMLT